MALSETQRAALRAPLDERLVREHPYVRNERTGKPAKYVPVQDIVLALNEVFGPDGYTREILRMERVHGPVQVEKESRGKKYMSWQTTWMAHVQIVLRDGGAFAGASAHTAYSNPPNPPNDRQAIEAAVSFATKQAAKLLGPRFGLLLGDEEDPYGEGWAEYMGAGGGTAAPPPATRSAPPSEPPPPPPSNGAEPPHAPPPSGLSADDREVFVRMIADYSRAWRQARGGKPAALLPYQGLGDVRALADAVLVALGEAVEAECAGGGVRLPDPTPDAEGGTPP